MNRRRFIKTTLKTVALVPLVAMGICSLPKLPTPANVGSVDPFTRGKSTRINGAFLANDDVPYGYIYGYNSKMLNIIGKG